MMEAASVLYNNAENLQVQDTPNIKISEIRSQARKMVRDNNVKVIFIDYIGLIECSGENKNRARYEQVMEISRSLKQLARELNIPVICLCQVSREAGKDRGPILADLRDSGSIEQDADLVILLDDSSKRLDEAGKAKYEEEEGEQTPGKARPLKVIIAKQRNGRQSQEFPVQIHRRTCQVDQNGKTIQTQHLLQQTIRPYVGARIE